MFTRPKSTDSVEDVLKMQGDFLAEKMKNPKFQPAATLVKIEKAPKKSLFAQKKRGELYPEQRKQLAENSASILGDVHEKKEQQTASSPMGVEATNFVFGEIIERSFSAPKIVSSSSFQNEGFPRVERTVLKNNTSESKSLFALSMEAKIQSDSDSIQSEQKNPFDEVEPMDCKPAFEEDVRTPFGERSIVIDDPETAEEIHRQNIKFLSQFKEEEILAERQKILDSIDPTLVSLLKKRRQQNAETPQTRLCTLSEVQSPINENNCDPQQILSESNAAVEILKRSCAEQWINFDIVEKDKLEWMRDIPKTVAKLKPGEIFEARFDWKGVLLPYSEETHESDNKKRRVEKDDRELYLHGDEPHRAGYTLPELFRLARSNIVQQRVSAFSAIAGILSIYNQGFYDNVLDLPISKIFFLLRFGLDENTPSILEVVSKGLAFLFYNETDEALLDFVYENTGCYWQPILQCNSVDSESDDPTSIENLQKQIKQLHMSSPTTTVANKVKANVDETEEESKTTMSDFQLAETDLIDCFLRTNIIQRVNFILSTERPNNSTVSACVKLLIRIARTSRQAATQIVNCDDLIECLFRNFLPGLQVVDTSLTTSSFYNYPQYLVLKLVRVLISQSLSIALKLLSLNIVDKIQNYLFNREDLKVNLIKVQIESLRVLRCLMLLRSDNSLYRKFLPAFRYMLEWHYHHVVYEEGGSFLIRQHASALLGAITSGPNGFEVSSILGDLLSDCCSSWFCKATKTGVKEFSQSTLLTACLNAVSWFTRNSDYEKFRAFNEKYLSKFIESQSFVTFAKSLVSSSIVLKNSADRRNIHPALPNVGTILVNRFGPQLVIPQTYSIYFLTSLWRLLEQNMERNEKFLLEAVIQVETIEPVVQFLKLLSANLNCYLATNFFAKCELKLIFKLLCFDGFKEYLSKTEILQVVYNFLCALTAEHIPEIEKLFEKVIFNREYLDVEQETLDKWRSTCLELVYPHYIVVPVTEICLAMPSSQNPILPRDWPYFQLKIILDDYLQNIHQKPAAIMSEREIIRMTLTFTSLLESNDDIVLTSPTEKLMYIMICFMGPDSQFLDPDMKAFLREHITRFYQKCRDSGTFFQFDAVFEEKCKFENLYALFVDHFQAASYGDDLFSSLVLIPMAQRYDNKWRRRIWSDYASALRFINCDESLLLYSIDDYLQPYETEQSLIKAYASALRSGLVRPNTIPHKIALHHFEHYKESLDKC